MSRRKYRLPPPTNAKHIVGQVLEFAPEDDLVNAGKPPLPTVELIPVGSAPIIYESIEFLPEHDRVNAGKPPLPLVELIRPTPADTTPVPKPEPYPASD